VKEPMDGWVKKALSARAGQGSETCPDDNLMAAYLETTLSPEEMLQFESHIADCTTCQELLAISMRLQAEGSLDSQPAPAKKVLFRFSVRIPVFGAVCLVAVLAAVVLFRISERPAEKASLERVAETPQVAEARVPARTAMEFPERAASPEKDSQAKVPNVGQASVALKPSAAASGSVEKQKADIAEAEGLDKKAEVVGKGRISAMNADPASIADVSAPLPAPQPASPGLAEAPIAAAVNSPAPAQDQLAQNTAIQGAGNALTQTLVQEPVSRPRVYAAQNRIAVAHYTNPSADAVVRHAIEELSVPDTAGKSEKKNAGDRTFYKYSRVWVDKQCLEHADAAIVEVAPEATEYEAIVKQYPDIRKILPSAIFWEGKIYLLR
jgi:hypothetical protein